MSRPRNPNPPVRTEIVRQKIRGLDAWYLLRREVQYSHETHKSKTLSSHAFGVVLDPDAMDEDIIPLDEWKARRKQERQARRQQKKEAEKAAKAAEAQAASERGERDACPVVPAEDPVSYRPQYFYGFLLLTRRFGFNTCLAAASYMNRKKFLLAEIREDFQEHEITEEMVRNFIILLGKSRKAAIMDLLEQLPFDAGKESEAFRPPYAVRVRDHHSSLVVEMEIADQANEFRHICDLFSKIDTRGAVVAAEGTSDREFTVWDFMEDGADYLVRVGRNVPKDRKLLEGYFKAAQPEEFQCGEETVCGQGWTERRSLKVLPSSQMPVEVVIDWPGTEEYGSAAQLTSTRRDQKTGKETTEITYLLSTLHCAQGHIADTILALWRVCTGMKKSQQIVDIIYPLGSTPCSNGEYLKGEGLLSYKVYEDI